MKEKVAEQQKKTIHANLGGNNYYQTFETGNLTFITLEDFWLIPLSKQVGLFKTFISMRFIKWDKIKLKKQNN